jgi:hypothetical protein
MWDRQNGPIYRTGMGINPSGTVDPFNTIDIPHFFAVQVQTLDATPIVLATISIPRGTATTVYAVISGDRADGGAGAGATYLGTWRNVGGVVTRVGADQVPFSPQDDVTWGLPTAVAIVDGINLRVTGKAATTINWGAIITVGFSS